MLSGNECAAPNCRNRLIASDGESIIGKICHIEAASKGGPRYNPNMTDEERRSFGNLILLCDEHHTIIDNKTNEGKYPVQLLQEWKQSHEETRLAAYSSNTSFLRVVINQIAEANFDSETQQQNDALNAFDIEEKLDYNAVKRNRDLINERKIFYSKISALYDELDAEGSIKKQRLLDNIRRLYLRIKGRYLENAKDKLAALRLHADDIIEEIEISLIASCAKKTELAEEDINFGIILIMVDAFMRCKILEEPSSHAS